MKPKRVLIDGFQPDTDDIYTAADTDDIYTTTNTDNSLHRFHLVFDYSGYLVCGFQHIRTVHVGVILHFT